MLNNWQKRKIIASKSYQLSASDQINNLVFKERRGKQIVLESGEELTEFMSCSYLGLDQHEGVIRSALDSFKRYGNAIFPAARTRIRSTRLVTLNELLNQVFCDSHTVIFYCIHMIHLGFLPMLGSGEVPSFPVGKNGVRFIVDKYAHESIQINRALMQQFGKVVMAYFDDHASVENAAKSAEKDRATPVFVADSVGSMGGTVSVEFLLPLAEKYDGYVYLDDAHGTSVYGKNGCGYVFDCLGGRTHSRLAVTASLAKAFGAGGSALVLPTAEDAEFVRTFCQTYIFSGPLPVSVIETATASANLHLNGEAEKLQVKLRENRDFFDDRFSDLSDQIVNFRHHSPVRGFFVGDELKAIKFCIALRKRGFAVTTAMYPTVAKNKAMLRIAICADHSRDQIEAFCAAVGEVKRDIDNVATNDVGTVSN